MKLKIVVLINYLVFLTLAVGAEQAPKYEFRAAWIATVLRLDWPSSSTVSSQQSQLIGIFDKMQVANFNAAILQIRPACDAFYDSDIEPWSN